VEFDFEEPAVRLREELRQLLDDKLPDWWRGMFVDDERAMPFTREMCALLAQHGWLTVSWPPEHGGGGADLWQQAVVREEMWAHDEPRGPQYMNLNYIGPLIMRFGNEEQQRRFLSPMARGEVIWCQGFSEPEAGSDLASLRTKAEADGDHFVVSGQKIWTSYADAPADWCLLLARTEPDKQRHEGISVFLMDMTTSGITVRPIDTMAGPHEFCEVFLDDVEIPADCLLGPRGGGWEVIRTGLTFERAGVARYARAAAILDVLVGYARQPGSDGRRPADDPAVRQQLADLRARCEAARLLSYRVVSMQAAGRVPTVEASIARLHNTDVEQLAGHVGLEVLGPAGLLTHDDPDAVLGGIVWRQWVRNIPTTVAAGTTEIQKNIVARGLGLPPPK
jgi:alkylation response protein AidB-like acyl-CoA dehydrogenase